MATVANLFIRISASATEFEKTLKGAEAQFNKLGGKFQAAGANLTKGLTLPLLAIGGAAVKAAVDFESSFAGIKKTVDGTKEEFAALAVGIREMAKTKPIDVNELNRIGELGGQLGIAKDGMLGFISTVADLGIATNLSTDQAAEGIARLSNIMQTPQAQFSNIGSTIVDLGNKLAASETEILDFGLRIAGAGEIAGLTEANVLAIGAAMASVGVEAEAGGTAVQKVLLTMVDSVNTGNEKLAVFAQTAGLSAAAFQDLFRSNPAEAFTLFVEGLGNAGQQASGVLKQLDLDDQRLVRSFLSLGNAGDLLRDSINTGTDAFAANNALAKEAGERYKTAESQFILLKNAAYDVGITLGTRLLPHLLAMKPAIMGAIEIIAKMVELFAMLPTPVQAGVLALAGIGVALGPVVYAVGTMIKVGSSLIGLFRLLPAGVGGAGSALGVFATRILPITAIVSGLVTIVYTLIEAFNQLGGAWSNAKAAWDQGGWKAVLGELGRNTKDDSMSLFKDWRIDQNQLPAVAGQMQDVYSTTRDVDSALALLETQLDSDVAAFNRVGNAGVKNLKNTAVAAKELLQSSKAISTLDPNYLSTGFTGVGGLGSAMQGSLGGMMDQLQQLGTSNRLRDAANSVMLGGAPMVEGNGQAVRQALQDSIDENAAAVAESVRSAFQYFAGALSPALAGALGGILNAFEKAIKSGKLGGFFGSKKFAGGLDAAMSGFGSGYGLGAEFGTGAGMLGGAASGALAGASFGPIGAAIGGIAGLIGGIFGGRKKKAQERQQMADAKAQLLEQFGGMENLRDVAERAGVSVEKLFSTTKAKEFKAEFEKVTAAIEEYQKKIAGIVTDLDKVMSEGGIIGADLWKQALANLDADEVKAKLLEVFDASVNKSAEGFNKIAQNFELIKAPLANIGVLADAAFGGLLANGASVVEAINQMGPGLQHIQEVLAKTGQTPTGPLADILNYQKVVEANAGIFELLSGVDDMLVGLANSGLLTQTTFSALGQTISQAFTQLTANGVAGTTALQLMQPQLQKLWELQKQFGFAVDSNTQSLLTQAEQQGIVGAQMQSTDQKILDVLIAIGTALGATIPQALLGLPPVAEQAAAGIGAAFEPGKITPKFQAIADAAKGALDQIPNQIPMELRMKLRNETGIRLDGINQAISAGIRIQPFAAGGIVTKPTMGLVGEAGPEAVIPLDEFNMNRGGLTIERVYGTVDRAFVKSIFKQVASGGDVKTAAQGALK